MKKWIQLSFDFKPWDNDEIWKDVINGKYEVSNLGNLVNKKTRKVIKGYKDKGGYLRDSFKVDGKIIKKFRHRLVYETFIGEIPEGMQINHKDENKQNNALSNIDTLMTCKENINWGTGNKRRAKTLTNHPKKSKSVIQKDLQGEVIRIWPSAAEVQRELGYAEQNISSCCKGKFKQMYGYIWEYIEEKATA